MFLLFLYGAFYQPHFENMSSIETSDKRTKFMRVGLQASLYMILRLKRNSTADWLTKKCKRQSQENHDYKLAEGVEQGKTWNENLFN